MFVEVENVSFGLAKYTIKKKIVNLQKDSFEMVKGGVWHVTRDKGVFL